MKYEEFEWRQSRVHIVAANLNRHIVKPVLAEGQEAFPFLRIYPVLNAVKLGSLASVGGGFNTTWYHHFVDRVADEPLHALVIDREIWTTGVGAGGAGVLFGDRWATIVERNKINITVWTDGAPLSVASVNHGHDAPVVAFTARGGTSECPREGKHYTVLSPSFGGWDWHPDDYLMRREMVVGQVSKFIAIQPARDEIVLESRWPLRLKEDDDVMWSQRLGAPGAHTVVSGWPQILKAGSNVVPLLGLHGEASHGPDNWFIRKNPRMCVGTSEDRQTVYLCAVEGRTPGSVGLRLKEMATMLRERGVFNAINFDGGGSAFMWLRDQDPQLVAPGCYNTSKTLQGLRPDHYSMSVFDR